MMKRMRDEVEPLPRPPDSATFGDVLEEQDIPPVGTRLLKRYRLDEELARGGVGVVFRARDLDLDREVAVKILPLSLDKGTKRERFLREAKIAATIGHPHVVKLHDFGFYSDARSTSQGRPFLVMELLDGASLAGRIRRIGPLTIGDSVSLASQLCSALTALHAKGIVHRDVKPGNVYLLKALGVTIKLIDFGMSKSFLDDSDAITEAGRVIGTPSYMAPEQLLGEAPDPRWDVYGVGLVMWEALVGVPYVKSQKRIEKTFRAVLERQPEAPSRLRGKIPPHLDEVVMRASSADPKNRYADCAEMKKACDDALNRLMKEQP